MTNLQRTQSRRALVETFVIACGLCGAIACATPSGVEPRGFPAADLPIDLSRFAGDWFVVAHIPLAVEAEAHAAVESYAMRDDGMIDIRFRFCDGSLDGPLEELTMLGWVVDPSTNADWRVRPMWPLRLSYQILELDEDYRFTVVVHPSKSYAWVMARTPSPSEAKVAAALERLTERGFDMARLRRVPHAEENCRGATP